MLLCDGDHGYTTLKTESKQCTTGIILIDDGPSSNSAGRIYEPMEAEWSFGSKDLHGSVGFCD